MKLLIVNDDGYNAPGIHALAGELAKKHEVYVVAPENERSGAAHSVSFFNGLTYRETASDYAGSYAVDGTPADCVLFGLKHILKNIKIDAVISGINSVLNVGSDILYSGTFNAAQEATYLRHKGIAVSLDASEGDYAFAAEFIADNLNALLECAIEDTTINVNIPYSHKELITGVIAVPVAYRPYNERFLSHTAHDGSEVYFISGMPISHKNSSVESDVRFIENGYITISPVKLLANAPEEVSKINAAEFTI